MTHKPPRSRTIGLAIAAATFVAAPSWAGEPLDGVWETPLGMVRLEMTGEEYVGTLEESNPACGFAKGSEVLRGRLVNDGFTGEVKVCFPARCKLPDQWLLAMAIPLDGGERLTGAVAPANQSCPNSVFKGQPFTLVRQKVALPAAALAPRTDDSARARKMKPEAQRLYREGMELSGVGRYEAARAKLLAADKADPKNPDVLTQIGITFYARGEIPKAERFYRRALLADSSSVLARYNLACVLVKQGRTKEALRELKVAVDNGYGAVSELDIDPDFAPIRGDPAFQEIRSLAERNAARAGR